ALQLGVGEPLQPRQAEYTGLIRQSGQHLLIVINDILDLAKVDAGAFVLHEETGLDCLQFIDACIGVMRGQAVAAGLSLTANVDRGMPDLACDPTRLRQILLNLLSNAVKFTPAGGSVVVAAYCGGSGDILFEVRDTGMGMTASDVEIAF